LKVDNKNSQMDPIQYWLLADDEQQDDNAGDFDLLSFLLREESGAAPPNLLLDWDNVFSEVDILDEYGNRCRQEHKTPRGKQQKETQTIVVSNGIWMLGKNTEVRLILFGTRIHGKANK
jgi:hypothetical protein